MGSASREPRWVAYLTGLCLLISSCGGASSAPLSAPTTSAIRSAAETVTAYVEAWQTDDTRAMDRLGLVGAANSLNDDMRSWQLGTSTLSSCGFDDLGNATGCSISLWDRNPKAYALMYDVQLVQTAGGPRVRGFVFQGDTG